MIESIAVNVFNIMYVSMENVFITGKYSTQLKAPVVLKCCS